MVHFKLRTRNSSNSNDKEIWGHIIKAYEIRKIAIIIMVTQIPWRKVDTYYQDPITANFSSHP